MEKKHQFEVELQQLDENYENAKDLLLRSKFESDQIQTSFFNQLKAIHDIAKQSLNRLYKYQANLPIDKVERNELIPYSVLEDIVVKYHLERAVLFAAADYNGAFQHVVTFGRTAHQSHLAAEEGNRLKEVLNWSEEDRKAISGKVMQMLEAMQLGVYELEAADKQKSTAYRSMVSLIKMYS